MRPNSGTKNCRNTGDIQEEKEGASVILIFLRLIFSRRLSYFLYLPKSVIHYLLHFPPWRPYIPIYYIKYTFPIIYSLSDYSLSLSLLLSPSLTHNLYLPLSLSRYIPPPSIILIFLFFIPFFWIFFPSTLFLIFRDFFKSVLLEDHEYF